MSVRCVALFSGGLDSMLSVRLMQEQGVDVEALNFKTTFTCCQDASGRAARELGVRLTVLNTNDDYLDVIKRPQFGYGRGANPCVDCRIYMFQYAWEYANQTGASFVVSGEVVGQRPMSQKRRDLDTISHHSGLADRLLRPLSAKVLPPTLPELQGMVDRSKLYGFVGRSRKGLIKLARQFGFKDIPSPSTGCALTEPRFSKKVHDLIQLDPNSARWDFELLKLGRHFRLDRQVKVIIGRNAFDNDQLMYMHEREDAQQSVRMHPHNFAGPDGLLIGPVSEAALEFCGGLVLRHAKLDGGGEGLLEIYRHGDSKPEIRKFVRTDLADQAVTLATIPPKRHSVSAHGN